MDMVWQTVATWIEVNQGALSAIVIAGVCAAPIVALRAVFHNARRRRVRALYADLHKAGRVWERRKDRIPARPRPSPAPSGRPAAGPAARSGSKPSKSLVGPHDDVTVIALPFENLIQDAEHAALAETFTHDLFTLIHQRPNLAVAQVQYGREANATVGTPLPLDHPYILEGALELLDGNAVPTVRLTVQILETATGERVYSDRYDGRLNRMGPLLDDIAESIAGALQSMMAIPNPSANGDLPTSAPVAWALYRRGEDLLRIGMSRQRADAAIRVLDHACRIDPGFGAAKCALARSLALRVLLLTSPDEDADLVRADAAIEAALILQPDTPERSVSQAMIALARGDDQGALTGFDQAARMDPTLSDLRIFRALASLYAGRPGALQNDALAPSSFDGVGPRSLAAWVVALAKIQEGALADADAILEASVAQASAFHMSWFLKAQGLALAGKEAEAKSTFARARRVIGTVDEAGLRRWIDRAASGPTRAQSWLAAFDATWR